ncbi:DUF3710 domain-containing protein [Bifidobacterium indicum]|uniref:DUF3710 domain-containing protein n=1 Tax=Bifidobacterium indicum TaxID=1691 RepID=UPI0030D89B73
MGLFGFGRKHKDDQVHQDRDSPELESEDPKDQGRKADQEPRDQDDQARESDQVGKDESKAEQYQVHGLTSGERGVDHGPWDSEDEDVVDYDDYLDIGSLMLPFLQGSQLRLKANGSTGEVLGATITYGSSSLELEAFAAPKTLGLWDDVRADLLRANPRCQEVDGVFGQELALPVNVRGKDLMTRVVGIDGPRWMLRGIFSGPAAKGGKEKDLLDRYLADLVVVRGDEPLAPRDLIPMHSPVTPDERRADSGQGGDEGDKPKDTIPEKPEGPFDSDQQTEVKTTFSRGPMFSEVR